jgi:2-phosphosulfolactate phosphatase
MHILHVYALPKLVDPEEMAGGDAVVLDVLRASTTIVHALAAGAGEVVACLDVERAEAIAAEHPPGEVVLGGERGGLPLEGFDLGNSPDEYVTETVAGRTVVFTTTNGTRAMAQCRSAERAWIAAFVNVSAVVRKLAGAERIHLLCAGTDGQMSDDDILLAGLLVHRLQQRGEMMYKLNAQALTAWETWKHAFPLPQSLGAEELPPERLAARLRDSLGGANLVAIGLEEDILAAAQIDRFDVVPALDPKTMRIRRG